MELRLVRVTEHENATHGVLCIDGSPELVTLEDAWRANERMISCIPEGKYKLRRHRSPKFGLCYQVADVPERSEILVHAGNTHHDTHGCILIGMRYCKFAMAGKTESGIAESKKAMAYLITLLSTTPEVDLIIISAYGGGRVH